MSMELAPQSSVAWMVVASLFHGLAILSTTFRVLYRFRTSQMWLDDYLVVIPLAMDVVFFAQLWVRFSEGFLQSMKSANFFNSFWFSMLLFSTVLWWSRIVLALSITRIFPAGNTARCGAWAVTAFMVCGFVISTIVNPATCQGPGTSRWYQIKVSNCLRGPLKLPAGMITTIVLDCMADIILTVYPLIVLRRIKLPRHQRRLILATFSASFLTFLSVVNYTVFFFLIFEPGVDVFVVKALTGHIEATISLTVANFVVVTMFFYRYFRRVPNVEVPEHRAPLPQFEETLAGRQTSIGHCPTTTQVTESSRPTTFSTLTEISDRTWSDFDNATPAPYSVS
ncbi:hypothetical protein B0H34DRAFT_709686 [Crassisporium funariophilum]|nr:hypothetical protein B0H34DRAFT_709686 [Crassisporium funariophilum]